MSNLLVIDAGNTNIVLGYYRDKELVHLWRIHTDRKKLADEYADLIDSLLQRHNLKSGDVDSVAVSNVVPALQDLLEKLAREFFNVEPFFVTHTNKMNMKIRLETPAELGADLIAAAVAGIELYEKPCIIVDFGTATTLTAIDKEGAFLGGVIAPGLNVTREALYTYAPHLPRVRMEPPPKMIASNTPHAMQAGIFMGYICMIEGIIERMKKEMDGNVRVIATGGLTDVFSKGSNVLDVCDHRLVLEGIRILYEMNVKRQPD